MDNPFAGQKTQEEFHQNIRKFQEELQSLVHKYSNSIPPDVAYMQLSFWAAVQMKSMIEMSQQPVHNQIDQTIN